MPIFDQSGNQKKVAVPQGTGEEQVVEVLDETQLDTVPDIEQAEPEQVKSDIVVFVAQEDFEGRINQESFRFVKGTRYEVTRDQANTWVEANKGYVIEA